MKRITQIKEASLTVAAVLMEAHERALKVLADAKAKADTLLAEETKRAEEEKQKSCEQAKVLLAKAVELAEQLEVEINDDETNHAA